MRRFGAHNEISITNPINIVPNFPPRKIEMQATQNSIQLNKDFINRHASSVANLKSDFVLVSLEKQELEDQHSNDAHAWITKAYMIRRSKLAGDELRAFDQALSKFNIPTSFCNKVAVDNINAIIIGGEQQIDNNIQSMVDDMLDMADEEFSAILCLAKCIAIRDADISGQVIANKSNANTKCPRHIGQIDLDKKAIKWEPIALSKRNEHVKKSRMQNCIQMKDKKQD
jgi:hypothetical protein